MLLVLSSQVMEELESYDAPEDYSENYMLTRGDPYSVFTVRTVQSD